MQHGLGSCSQQQERAHTGISKHREALAKSHRPAGPFSAAAFGLQGHSPSPRCETWQEHPSCPLGWPACGARQKRDSPQPALAAACVWDKDLWLSA